MLLLIDYIFYYQIETFQKESKLLFLVLKRLNINKDVSMYICRHLSDLHNILPHPSFHYEIDRLLFDTIDRGVHNYKSFSLFLKFFLPNLKILTFSQKYSSPNTKDLCFFIKLLQLNRLCILDQCGEDWNSVDWNELLNIMPNDSQYQFVLSYEGYLEGNDKKITLKQDNSKKSLQVLKYDESDDYKMHMKYDSMYSGTKSKAIENKLKYIIIN